MQQHLAIKVYKTTSIKSFYQNSDEKYSDFKIHMHLYVKANIDKGETTRDLMKYIVE